MSPDARHTEEWKAVSEDSPSVLSDTGHQVILSGRRVQPISLMKQSGRSPFHRRVNDCSSVGDGNAALKIISSTSLVYMKGNGDVEEICSAVTQQDTDSARIRVHAPWVLIPIHPATSTLPPDLCSFTHWDMDLYKLTQVCNLVFLLLEFKHQSQSYVTHFLRSTWNCLCKQCGEFGSNSQWVTQNWRQRRPTLENACAFF